MFDVIIVGAGLAGVLSALKIPSHLNVLLIESGSEVLPVTSSSYNECYKLHTGVHYVGDAYTAKNCLLKSIEFARELPDYISGGHDLRSPWRRGRHYFMSNSLVSVDKAREIALHLQSVYAQMIREDERNKIFGEPEDFVQFLTPADYPHIKPEIPFYDSFGNMSGMAVALGIETAESQIDIHRLKSHLQQRIASSKNITFVSSTKVTHLSHNPRQFGYIVSTRDEQGNKRDFKSTSVVNCSWQNIESLDRSLGLYVPDENRVIRIKASVLVELPNALKNMNTCIFSSGPYCSMTVLPNGTAILTSERTTNVGYFKAGNSELPPDVRELVNNQLKLNHPFGHNIAEQIRNECASYLTDELGAQLCHSNILALHVGFVKLMENEDKYTRESIYQAGSVIHARQQDGIEVRDLGYISNSGMKMTYTAGNATIIANTLDEHFKVIHQVIQLIIRIKHTLLPLPEALAHHEKNLDSILYIHYRSRLKEMVLSPQFSSTPEICVKRLADEMIALLQQKDALTNNYLQSYGLFRQNRTVAAQQDGLEPKKENHNPSNKL
jgi:hypothetical protein